MESEINHFDQIENVKDLPPIFTYWSLKYLTPKFKALNIPGVTELFVQYAVNASKASGGNTCRIASLGAGNCDTEVDLMEQLLAAGVTNCVVDCIDVNACMLSRGRKLASERNVSKYLRFIKSDVKEWGQDGSYSVVIANQSLHHFQDLEVLMATVASAIGPQGVFVVSDMIGRNGHMRWPEALKVLNEIWASMPQKYKYNHQLKRLEEAYDNWDCSQVGFEGVRAQDILPLLIRSFHFELFLAFGNVIDVFIDRGFGHNFDVTNSNDLEFIDKVAQLDEELLARGTVKPTHAIAAMRMMPCGPARVYRHFTPSFCLRIP